MGQDERGLISGYRRYTSSFIFWIQGITWCQDNLRNEGRYGNKRQKECEEAQEAKTGEAKETRGKEEIVSLGTN